MQKSINIFSAVLLKIFNLISHTDCTMICGEPDYPEELLK